MFRNVRPLFVAITLLNLTGSNAADFQNWYGRYRGPIVDVAGAKCYSNYSNDYFPEYPEYPNPTAIDQCRDMAACLIENLSEFDKADMASATVILGLMPTIISYLGPTVEEIALISSRRPSFAVLMALGAPAISTTRSFELQKLNVHFDSGPQAFKFLARKKSPFWAAVVSFVELVILAGAIVNSLHNSWQIGNRSVLSWKCLWHSTQLIWNLVPLVPYFSACLSLRLCKTMKNKSNWVRRLKNEIIPTSNQTSLAIGEETYQGRASVLLNWFAGISAYVIWIYGTLVFSSTLFVGTLSAVGIISRYAASAFCCRAILLFELAGLEREEGADEKEYTSASTKDRISRPSYL